MEAFIFSVNSVSPLFLIIAIGWLLRKSGMIGQSIIDGLNTITFNVGLPILLFRDMAKSDLFYIFAPSFILYALLSTLVLFILCWVFAELFIKDKSTIGSFVQGCYRGNYAIVGLLLTTSVLGHPGKSPLIIAFAVPLYNILAIILLSARSKTPQPIRLSKIMLGIAKNPLIIGILCGLPFALLQIPLFTMSETKFVATAIDYMAVSANPLALLAIGAAINFDKLKAAIRKVLTAALIKLFIGPLLCTGLAYLLRNTLHFSGEDLLVLFVLYGVPTAVASYVMASKMNNDADLAADIVLVTSVVSLFSLTFGIYIFKATGVI
jgi:predicted permease